MPQADNRTALVLVENEVTAGHEYDFWQDVTGERYHFPNRYRSHFVTGTPFVYYRGSRRRYGSRATPEYFGCGRVGEVFRDPETPASLARGRLRWICTIEDYVPFVQPVPFRIDGETLEGIPQNLWGVGVRRIAHTLYERIVALGGARAEVVPWESEPEEEEQTAAVADPHPAAFSDLFAVGRGGLVSGVGGAGLQTFRRSARSHLIGRKAEAVALAHLRKTLPPGPGSTLRWLADEGITPGWDIEYLDSQGNRIAVEVKGTTGPTFLEIELTAREWDAARRLKEQFHICLVALALTEQPRIAFLEDPHKLYAGGELVAMPLTWRIQRSGSV